VGSSTINQIKLPVIPLGEYDFLVDWGDGTVKRVTTHDSVNKTHSYEVEGIYNVTISGTLNGWSFVGSPYSNNGDRLKILSVEKWGTDFRLGATDQQFNGCGNLELQQVEDVLDLTGTTSFASSFRLCGRLTDVRNMNSWNTTNITSFLSTFQFSPNFNTNIGDWNTENVTNFFQAFANCIVFNNGESDSIKNWNTSKVTNMTAVFQNATKFNQEIGTWDISNVEGSVQNLIGCTGAGISSGVFNNGGSDSIKNWNTSKITNMQAMFFKQPNFNQDVSTKEVTVDGNTYTAWDTLNVTNMSFIFANRLPMFGTFNQNIGNWNTSKATSMLQILTVQPNFNQDISTKVVTVNGVTYTAWDTSNVTNMSFMFYNEPPFFGSFNQNISNWNTIKVTNMAGIFENQVLFNHPLNSWDTSKVTNMADMFNTATSFNQLINNWNVSLVTTFTDTSPNGFMGNKTFEDYSSANYDALLIGWSSRPVLPNLAINFGTIKYSSAGVSARAILTSAPNNWTIVDGGEI
jgi:surface protein